MRKPEKRIDGKQIFLASTCNILTMLRYRLETGHATVGRLLGVQNSCLFIGGARGPKYPFHASALELGFRNYQENV